MSAGHTKLVKNGGEKETAKMMEGGGGKDERRGDAGEAETTHTHACTITRIY